MMATLQITLPSDLNLISPLRQFVGHVVREQGLHEEAAHDVEIALTEALTNVIEHNYRMTASYRLDIKCSFMREKCVMEVQDEGRPFDPTRVKVPSLEEQRVRRDFHLGMMYIRRCVDELHYQSRQGRNTLTMVKYLASSKSPLAHRA